MSKRFYTSGRTATDTALMAAKKPNKEPELIARTRAMSAAPTTPEQKAAAFAYLSRRGLLDVAEMLGLQTECVA